jgi:hypothetical protein
MPNSFHFIFAKRFMDVDFSKKNLLFLDENNSTIEKTPEKFKRPQMDTEDETLLMILGPKYKNDWKKISKRVFNLRNKRYNPKFLMSRYKELVTDFSVKRIRFTHDEDMMIAKYFKIYGNDWNKIASHFDSRTSIMLKNRYYSHIKKRNLLNKLFEETNEEEKMIHENEPMMPVHLEEENMTEDLECLSKGQPISEENGSESSFEVIHFLSKKNESVKFKTLKIPFNKIMFEMDGYLYDQQLNEKITLLPN